MAVDPRHIEAVTAWHAEAEARYDAELTRLLALVPGLADAEGWPVRLHCPRGHALVTVRAARGDERRVLLVHAERVDPRRVGVAEPTLRDNPMPSYVLAASVRLTCAAPRCAYTGVHRHETLLRHYASALALGRHEAHLND